MEPKCKQIRVFRVFEDAPLVCDSICWPEFLPILITMEVRLYPMSAGFGE
jgi:hypothetical protein